MPLLIASFLVSLVIAMLLIRSAESHGHRSSDHDLSGPQKFHSRPVPRIGGIAVFGAIVNAQVTRRAGGSHPSLAQLPAGVLAPSIHQVYLASAVASILLVAAIIVIPRRLATTG